MKIVFLLLALGALHPPVATHAQIAKVSLNMERVELWEVLHALEQQTNYTFLYENEALKNKKTVKVQVNNKDLKTVLNDILSPEDLSYTLDDNVIIIKTKRQQERENKEITPNSKTPIIISGQVLDEDEQPLTGATIMLKGTKQLVIADIDGNYQIQVPAQEASLVFSFMGMESQELPVGKQSVINVTLKYSSIMLDDVVVVGGYGFMQKRSDLVGSAYQINSKQIKDLPTNRVDLLLEGKAPGVSININTDGADNPRPRYNTRVRGAASMSASSEPLYIVDGMPIYTGDRTNMIPGMDATISPLSFIDPNDIESITVLKDASAVSIYGANGSNGVIIITTKKGQQSRLSVSASTRYGISHINKNTLFKVLDASQYMMLAQEAYNNESLDPRFFPYQDNQMNTFSNTNTNWTDAYYDNGYTSQTNLSIRGGSNDVKYYVSGNYFQNTLTLKGNDQQRFALRSNLDMTLSKKLLFTLNSSVSYNVNTVFNSSTDYYKRLPIYSPYNSDGTFRLWNHYITNEKGVPVLTQERFLNSVAEREENEDRQRTMAVFNKIGLEYSIFKSLKLTSEFGVDYTSIFRDAYQAQTNWAGMSYTNGVGDPRGYSNRNQFNSLVWTTIHRLNYNDTFGKHTIGALLGFEANSKAYNTLGASGNTFANDHIKEISYAVNQRGTSSASETRYASFLGKANYSYDGRYYLDINTRMDGNSDFGTDSRWAAFGSLGLAWNIHNESFFNSPKINILKLKGAFGSSGNSRLGSQRANGIYSYSESANYGGTSGARLADIPNPKLSWETTYMANIGLRIKMFDRLDIEIEAYNNKTINLLSDMDVSQLTGNTTVTRNFGEIRNQGIEMTIQSDNIVSKTFNWSSDFNISHNRNKLLKAYNDISKAMGNFLWEKDYDMRTFYLVRWAGVDPRDGNALWYDANGNITRSYSLNNRVPYKSANPLCSGGLTNTFSYKDFSLNAFLTYTIGGYAFTTFGRDVSSDGNNIDKDNQSVNQLDRWQNPGDMTTTPKPYWKNSPYSVRNSTRFLYNTTHLRLKNIALAYQIPNQFLKSKGIKSCNLSFIVDNLGVWTPYDKKDRNSYKQSMSGYPMETTFSLGLAISL